MRELICGLRSPTNRLLFLYAAEVARLALLGKRRKVSFTALLVKFV